MPESAERALLGCVLTLVVCAAAAADLDVAALMRLLASVQQANARYVEVRYSALLTEPLVSRGTLVYTRPGRLEKHVTFPYEEHAVLDAGQLTIDKPGRGSRIVLSAADAPAVAGLVESIRATRAGDLAALERDYKVDVGGSTDAWWLRLRPRERELAQLVRSVTVQGAGARIERVEIDEASGDRVVMEIEEQIQ